MNTIQEIFTQYAPEYIRRFGDAMPVEHRKVIDAIIDCRTQSCGLAVYQCDKCHSAHSVFRSCGNRHCPVCQNHKTQLGIGSDQDIMLIFYQNLSGNACLETLKLHFHAPKCHCKEEQILSVRKPHPLKAYFHGQKHHSKVEKHPILKFL